MALTLIKFRTQNFRSIVDSGWVRVDDVTALVGINESGKSNILLSLWKLNPAREGAIDPVPDFPRDRYNEIRSMEKKPIFISGLFSVDEELAKTAAAKTGLEQKNFTEVMIIRKLCGSYEWSFPQCSVPRTVDAGELDSIISAGRKELEGVDSFQKEGDLKERMLAALSTPEGEKIGILELKEFLQATKLDREQEAESSKIAPIFDDVIGQIRKVLKRLERPEPIQTEGLWDIFKQQIPKFVYYSNYGNLDSEIYLPHVIENLKRDDLGEKEAAKSRTLRVLFDFVNLRPQEILELGHEVATPQVTDETIEADAQKKKEREILLTSASTQLTNKFRDWWKQGNYRFRFNADGNHFRIWVSDDVRTEEIELEERSTGLQWFFSFYLVFLVESREAHHQTVLLLDEAGLSLHPLAQRDLSYFFDSLSNQIVYTTHSPFLMESDALDRVRSVYLNEDGRTVVSEDLRADPKLPSSLKSIYAVHVALGLSVSDTFLLGCLPIIVEGVSDQRYLTAIKNHLTGKSLISPAKDIVFLPAGGTGTKGVSAVVSVICAKDENLPRVLVDSDKNGDDLKARLLSTTYKGMDGHIKQVSDYGVVERGEIEDLIPPKILARIVTRYLPRPAGSDEEFDEIVDTKLPIVPQVEAYAEKHDISLEKGWKVEVSTEFKNRLGKLEIDSDTEGRWTKVFSDFLQSEENA